MSQFDLLCDVCGCVMSPTSGIYWVELGFINNYKESQLWLVILRYSVDVASVFPWVVTKCVVHMNHTHFTQFTLEPHFLFKWNIWLMIYAFFPYSSSLSCYNCLCRIFFFKIKIDKIIFKIDSVIIKIKWINHIIYWKKKLEELEYKNLLTNFAS